ncbi:MAG: hypothetical protein IKM00_08900, partial [Clostridia bacterium]|nr:hypothetical protein [Clostridia bacterium]
PVGAPKEKPPYDQQFPKEPRAAQHPCVKRTVLRFAQAFAQSEWALRYTIPICTGDQTAGLPTSFLQLFSFWERKKLTVPPYQREIFYKKSCPFTEEKSSFCFKIFEYEKSYLIHIRIIVKIVTKSISPFYMIRKPKSNGEKPVSVTHRLKNFKNFIKNP